ncbi:hypothetical protein [Flectobacillus major]|uniref:hypothetical protein n=1 Tax=Flectobacillus major TaxID=103 RepID=UPI0004092F2C|nr:hypothetical protein [Flectobacillus major]
MKKKLNDYDAFIAKFQVKKTTDDCYTPPAVYEIALNYVREKCNIDGLQIIRPFYPGGDFEAVDYPENSVVVDNPPFSIISKIVKYYTEKKVKFFLFAPHITLFTSDIDVTYIVVGADVTYENGAIVKTSFISNLFSDEKIIGDADLFNKLKNLEKVGKVSLPKYSYPDNVVTVSKITAIVEKGFSIEIGKKHIKHCRVLDFQKSAKKAIFGSGFLVSDQTARQVVAHQAATQKPVAQKEKVTWELSCRELEIIKTLG